MSRFRRFAAAAALIALAGPPLAAVNVDPAVAKEVLDAMDRGVDPCQDFYLYACGGWIKSTPLPPDQNRWIRSISVMNEENQRFLRELFEEAARQPGDDSDLGRAGAFYAACMDEPTIEAAGLKPLGPALAAIDEVHDAHSLMALLGRPDMASVDAFFSLGADNGQHDPTQVIAFLGQGGLGLGDRQYYLSADPDKRKLLAQYREHVARMMALLGERHPAAAAKAVVKFETALAKISHELVDVRNPQFIDHPFDRARLAKLTPGLDWGAFFTPLGMPAEFPLNVETLDYLTGVDRLVHATRASTLQRYLRWRLVDGAAPRLGKAFVDEHFAFFGRTLSGQKEISPRWKRCAKATSFGLTNTVGRLYVERRFPGDSKAMALAAIDGIERAFVEALPGLSWMDAETRQRAVAKKEAMANYIGYPDQWIDESSIPVTRDGYYQNVAGTFDFRVHRQLAKVGHAADAEWTLPAQLVNAGYNPTRNRITFPAAILQPPMFSRELPPAMNYGAIGTVMGHEITHGFDDTGRRFDPQGRLEEWWAPEVVKRFEEKTQCLVDQYDRFEMAPGLHVNGKLTLGENIADLGGLKEAYTAFEHLQAERGPSPTVEGLTPEQLFFVARAQIGCTVGTPEGVRRRLVVDVHSPNEARVLVPLRDFAPFAEVFQCAPGTPMNPPDKCEIW